ncbi:hypothetical protein RHMOL_Rhmol02G0175000 [Rhododendron molle]|uniref:Uncharacterized protein n=1 Tax=Rhododendron molle TaxID=49168 RepID=A0ACC0PSW3_RHOML|nr:hypothetical protein RHMOL_Rhmol02G0175000 [Rhododendron molle]
MTWLNVAQHKHGHGLSEHVDGHGHGLGLARHSFSGHVDWHGARKWVGTTRKLAWQDTTRHGLAGHGHDTVVERARHDTTWF